MKKLSLIFTALFIAILGRSQTVIGTIINDPISSYFLDTVNSVIVYNIPNDSVSTFYNGKYYQGNIYSDSCFIISQYDYLNINPNRTIDTTYNPIPISQFYILKKCGKQIYPNQIIFN
jgi:hypothetical protein